MTKDIDWGIFFRDEERFADFINGSIRLEGGDFIAFRAGRMGRS